MAYIFMDESGCLGFDFTKPKTSDYFVITFLFSENKRALEKVVKKTFNAMPSKHRCGHPGVLHANKEQSRTRMYLFNILRERDDISVMVIRLNKRKVYTRLQDEKAVLYNYITNILLDRIITKNLVSKDDPIHLIASRRETNRFLNENFKGYLLQQNHGKINLVIEVKSPAEEKGLQVVDFISWALFRRYEHGDESYFNLIRGLIVEDSPLFP